jgi:hypothetical protein
MGIQSDKRGIVLQGLCTLSQLVELNLPMLSIRSVKPRVRVSTLGLAQAASKSSCRSIEDPGQVFVR